MKIFQPSILLHSLAIFKGMKPIYQMISKQPWHEVQLYISLQSLIMLLKSSITTIWWMIVLSRYIFDIMRLYNIYHNDYIETLNRSNTTLDIF
uniref:Uncharacterized protein n=1 Tax=Chromulina nebulosa TaxID=96789 RepID=A0A7S0SWQ9_9STRA